MSLSPEVLFPAIQSLVDRIEEMRLAMIEDRRAAEEMRLAMIDYRRSTSGK